MQNHIEHISALITQGLQKKEVCFLLPLLEKGKMLRPQLCIYTAQAFDQPITHSSYLLAAALECIHLASLLHDDVIDATHTRRGRNSAWVHHGTPAAILGGDYLLAHSLSLAHKAHHPNAIDVVARKTKQVIRGELLQYQSRAQTWSRSLYTRITSLKTASLFEAAIALFAPPEHKKKLERAGTLLGIAFQVLNDLKDYQFLWDKTPPGPDIIERRMSAPLLWLLHHSKKPLSLLDIWFQPELTPLVEALKKERVQSMLHSAFTAVSSLSRKAYSTCTALAVPRQDVLHHFIHNTIATPLAQIHAVYA